MTEHTWLTAAEVADRLRISRKTVYRHAATGTLPSRRLGRTVRFHTDDIERALKEGQR